MSKIPEVIQTTMSKIRDMVDANTVVGSPMTVADGVTLVPISKITLGVASGGADLAAKQPKPEGTFSGGAGCGVCWRQMRCICLCFFVWLCVFSSAQSRTGRAKR